MKIQNYGEWKGDKPGGHHPPACTCYRCNEERRRLEASKEEERRVKEYDRRVAETQARSGGGKQQSSPNPSPSQDRAPARSQPQSSRSNQGSRNRASQSSQSPRTSSRSGRTDGRRQLSVSQRQVPARNAASKAPETAEQGVRDVEGHYCLGVALRYRATRGGGCRSGGIRFGSGVAPHHGGAPSMMPTLDGASEAYVHAWRTAGALVGLG